MQNKTFDNRDFYLSAYLMAVGYKLISHRKAHNITTFIFDDSEELQYEVSQYFSMTASVEPMAYGLAQRALKSVIHSTNTNSKGTNNNNVQQQNRGK